MQACTTCLHRVSSCYSIIRSSRTETYKAHTAALAGMGGRTVLISNDDGINAPGLRALVAALVADGVCTVCVCGPADEQSAKSHAITLGRPLLAYPIAVPNVDEAIAVGSFCFSWFTPYKGGAALWLSTLRST